MLWLWPVFTSDHGRRPTSHSFRMITSINFGPKIELGNMILRMLTHTNPGRLWLPKKG